MRHVREHFGTQPATVPVAKPDRKPRISSKTNLKHLRAFNKKYLGFSDYDETQAALGKSFYDKLNKINDVCSGEWKQDIPSRISLLKGGFGRPDINHSFNQEACFDTAVFSVIKSGFLEPPDIVNLFDSHPLINHLAAASVAYSDYDFRWVREYNPNWADQSAIDPDRIVALTAALFHFNLDTSMLMRYMGNNYTGEYRNIDAVVNILKQYNIEDSLISKYIRVMTVGCPNHFVASTS